MDRPFVTMNMAMTVDGKITSSARELPEFSSEEDRRTMDRIRATCDAVIVGAGTVRADDPPMQVRHRDAREARAELGKPAALWNVVVSASARLDASATFFTSGTPSDRLVVTVDDADAAALVPLEAHATVWRCGRERVDLAALVVRLRSELGIERLLLEGGGELNAAFVGADLLDELHVTVAPALLGGRDAPTWLEGDGLSMAGQRRLRLLDVRRHGDELFLRYKVLRG